MAQPTHIERILVVTDDPDTADLIAQQALGPMHYHVRVVQTVGEAIQEMIRFVPDLVLTDLRLPDLSAKDLLAALQAQGRDVPVMVMGRAGDEHAILQAFRLGALDYLALPAREAEVVAAVDRALKQVRERKERRLLAQRLEQTNRALRQRIEELDRLFQLSKALAAPKDPTALYQRLVTEAVAGADADRGWLVLRHDQEKRFYLVAHKGLPKTWLTRYADRWDDGITPLIALSGEPLNIHGEPLSRFRAAQLGKAVLVAPVRVQDQTVGVLGVARREMRPFSKAAQAFVQAVADLTAVALVNIRLFQALEQQAQHFRRQAQQAHDGAQRQRASIAALVQDLKAGLDMVRYYLERLQSEELGPLSPAQQETLARIHTQIEQVQRRLQQQNPA